MTEQKRSGERRAETARENDDSDIIAAAQKQRTPGQKDVSGGGMQRDIASQAEEQRVEDPAGRESRTKEDEMAQGAFSPGPRSVEEVVSERKD